MPLHPVAQQLLDEAAASDQPNCHLLSVEEARANFERLFAGLPSEVAVVTDLTVSTEEAELPCRLYSNHGATTTPLLLFLHGGGWQMGSLNTHDGLCRSLANATGYAVLSVGYRQPPEHKFPAAPRDCYAVLAWAVDHAQALGIDPERIAVVGDSAGGNLAAAVSLQARDLGRPDIACQVLVYPATTFDLDQGFDPEFEGYVLFRDEVQWHKDAYFAVEEEATSDYASPLNADLRGLPPTLVVTAEFDPLRNAGRALASALEEADVETDLTQYDGMLHGFIQLPALFDDATAALKHIAEYLHVRLEPSAS
jgi:acetyl esterase/lipase